MVKSGKFIYMVPEVAVAIAGGFGRSTYEYERLFQSCSGHHALATPTSLVRPASAILWTYGEAARSS